MPTTYRYRFLASPALAHYAAYHLAKPHASWQAEASLRELAHHVPGVVYLYLLRPNGSSCFPYASEGIFDVYGVTPQQVVDDASPVFAVLDPNDLERIRQSIQASAESLSIWHLEYRAHHPTKGWIWLEGRATPRRLDDGSVLWHGFIADISRRKHHEAVLAEQARQLQASNADLEQFAYAVSHDMRQPLRMVSSYLQLLERSLSGRLQDDEQEFLAFALDGARRMDSMIVSLLEYSRVGRKTSPKQLLSTRETLDEALAFLQPDIVQAAASITVQGEWPQATVSRDEMVRLFQNLIGNALKYHDVAQAPIIQINSACQEKTWQVSVRDYGIGINPAHIDRLFKVFSRLQARSRFEGCGVGLALCRRIVQHHDGEIGVHSEGEGLGATFWFSLPLLPADAEKEDLC